MIGGLSQRTGEPPFSELRISDQQPARPPFVLHGRVAALIIASVGMLFAPPSSAQVFERTPDGNFNRIGDGWEQEQAARVRAGRPMTIPPIYRDAIFAAAARYDLSPELLDAVARTESRYDPAVVSSAGAIGIMQLMPDTARSLGVNPWDPTQNIMGGAAYLRALLDRFDGEIDKALAAYNAGPGRVVQYSGVPPFAETRVYVSANLDRLAGHSLSATPPVPQTLNGADQ